MIIRARWILVSKTCEMLSYYITGVFSFIYLLCETEIVVICMERY